jgi:hypothetical protein
MDRVNIYTRTGPRGTAIAYLGHDGRLYTELSGFPSTVRTAANEAEARRTVDSIYEVSCVERTYRMTGKPITRRVADEVAALEDEGLSTSDAQAVAEARHRPRCAFRHADEWTGSPAWSGGRAGWSCDGCGAFIPCEED